MVFPDPEDGRLGGPPVSQLVFPDPEDGRLGGPLVYQLVFPIPKDGQLEAFQSVNWCFQTVKMAG